jgi:hypothetical protein
MGKKIVRQKGVKGDKDKVILRRAPNKPLREIKKVLKKTKT